MKHKYTRRNIAIISAIITCGSVVPAMSQSLFDVFFLSDTTGSMGSPINGVGSSSNLIVGSFLGTGNDVLFGVGEYKDGNADAFAFRYNLVNEGLPIFSSSAAAISSAIGQWSATGGGDIPEDNLLALRSVAETAPWRPGSRRIVYWFGDAPSLDPGSDGTTLSATLAALAANCIEVFAVDVSGSGSLDDGTGQVPAIVNNTLDCGRDGGELIELNLSGLTPEEAAELILSVLSESFVNVAGDNTVPVVMSGNINGSIILSRTMTRDVGSRLFTMRAGMHDRPLATTTTQAAPSSAKGGKAGMATETISASYNPQWEVWGQMYYSDDSQDALTQAIPGGGNRLLRADTDTEILGGSVGVERRLGGPWSVGLAFGYAEADVDMRSVADTDIDSFALIPYVSYYRPAAVMGADFYADALYAYSSNDYSTSRTGGARGDTDGDSHQIELNAGLNLRNSGLIHGPYAQLRWLDGDIDGYTESGPGSVTYPDTDYESLATQLGYQVSYPVAIQGGTLVPQFTAAWEHEFEENQGTLGGIPLGEVDEDLAVLGVGLGLYLNTGWNMVLDYQARLGSDTENHYVGFKLGREF